MKHLPKILVFIVVATAIITRFVNITWGQPYFFHPDERNIAASISQLKLTDLNPHFFAYGSLPIYLLYSVGLLGNFITSCKFSLLNCTVSFEQAIIISRLLSAIFSCLSLLFLYRIAEKLWTKRLALLVLLLGTFSTGFIQFSHFGTYEMWSVFFSLLLFDRTIAYGEKPSLRTCLGMGVIVGTLVSIKVSNIVFFPISLVVIGYSFIPTLIRHFYWGKFRVFCKHTLLIGITTLAIYGITNPYVFLASKEFLGSFTYEKTVATGELPVFYTQEFLGTIPIFYQVLHVFPFLLNPLLTVLLPSIIITGGIIALTKKQFQYALLILFFFISFIPQAILFIKWTRNSVITLPFIFLLVPSLFSVIHNKSSKQLFATLLVVTSVIFSLSYFKLVYLEEDTRVVASHVAKRQIPTNAHIISEVYDMGIVPFNASFPRITLVNTYDMEHDQVLFNEFQKGLKSADYIISPSQRVIKTRIKSPDRFPKGYYFYSQLSDANKYAKLYQTPCQLLCQIVYLGNPDYFEMTASVFDRPVVSIYKKL